MQKQNEGAAGATDQLYKVQPQLTKPTGTMEVTMGNIGALSQGTKNGGALAQRDQNKDVDQQTSERIKEFVWDKFNLDDIRELELRPVDEDSDDDYDNSKEMLRHRKIDELYDIIKVVGAGGFGIVIACRDRSTNKKFALKIAARYHAHAASSLRQERSMLSCMSHPNIIRVYEMHREYKNLVIMKMELGKETITNLVERHQRKTGQIGLPEEQCAKIMKGLFRALAYLHDEQNVIHRDIKPDNIVIGSHKDLTRVKLVDFGLAVQDSLDKITDYAKCGTFLYKPPEQVTNIFAYAKKADVWASGIIMFYMLTGRHPIWKEGITKLQMEQIMKNFIEIELPDNISPQAKHLISCLCQKNQSARYRAANALQHPWITRNLEQELPLSDLDRRALAIQNQPIEEKLRKAMRVLMVCALSKQHHNATKAISQQSPKIKKSKDLQRQNNNCQENSTVTSQQEKQQLNLTRSTYSRFTRSSSNGACMMTAATAATLDNSCVGGPAGATTTAIHLKNSGNKPATARMQKKIQQTTTQQSSGSSLPTPGGGGATMTNCNSQQAKQNRDHQLESYKQMIMTSSSTKKKQKATKTISEKEQSPSKLVDKATQEIAQLTSGEGSKVNRQSKESIGDDKRGPSSCQQHQNQEVVKQSSTSTTTAKNNNPLSRKSSYNVLLIGSNGSGSARLASNINAKATRDSTPKSLMRNRAGIGVNQASNYLHEKRSSQCSLHQQSLMNQPDQVRVKDTSDVPPEKERSSDALTVTADPRKLVQAKTDDRLQLNAYNSGKNHRGQTAAPTSKNSHQQATGPTNSKKGGARPPINTAHVQHKAVSYVNSIKLPAKLLQQQISGVASGTEDNQNLSNKAQNQQRLQSQQQSHKRQQQHRAKQESCCSVISSKRAGSGIANANGDNAGPNEIVTAPFLQEGGQDRGDTLAINGEQQEKRRQRRMARKLSAASSKKSHKLPTKRQKQRGVAGAANVAGNCTTAVATGVLAPHNKQLNPKAQQTMSLQLSPKGRREATVSNRSKQSSFYSRNQFEHDDSDDDMDNDVGRVGNDTDEDREAMAVDKSHQAAAKFLSLNNMTGDTEEEQTGNDDEEKLMIKKNSGLVQRTFDFISSSRAGENIVTQQSSQGCEFKGTSTGKAGTAHLISQQFVTASRNDKIATKSPCQAKGAAIIMESRTMDEKTSTSKMREELDDQNEEDRQLKNKSKLAKDTETIAKELAGTIQNNQKRKQHRREFKTQRTGVAVQMAAKLDKSTVEQNHRLINNEDHNQLAESEYTPPGEKQTYVARHTKVCETDNRRLLKQRINLNSANSSQHNNYFVTKPRTTKQQYQNHANRSSQPQNNSKFQLNQQQQRAQQADGLRLQKQHIVSNEFIDDDDGVTHEQAQHQSIIVQSAATQARRQQKQHQTTSRREKFASLKKAQLGTDCDNLLQKPSTMMKLPGITPKPPGGGVNQRSNVAPSLFSEKKSMMGAESMIVPSTEQRLQQHRQFTLIGSHVGEPIQTNLVKGMTPKRNQDNISNTMHRKQQIRPYVLPIDFDSQQSSTSNLSPCMAKGRLFQQQQTLKKQTKHQQLHEQFTNQKSANPIRSTQAAGNAIVQGNTTKKQPQQHSQYHRGNSSKLSTHATKDLGNVIPSAYLLTQDGTSQVLHGLVTQKYAISSSHSKNKGEKVGAGLLLLSQAVQNCGQPSTNTLLYKRSPLSQKNDSDDEDVTDQTLNDRETESPKPTARAFEPLLNKQLKQTSQGSSENDLASAIFHHHQHRRYHRSIDKREKKHKLKAVVDPDDLDLLDFDLPASTSHEKPKISTIGRSVGGAQSRFLNNICNSNDNNNNNSKNQGQQPQPHIQSHSSAKPTNGSQLSKKHTKKYHPVSNNAARGEHQQQQNHQCYQRAHSDILSPFTIQCFTLK